MYPKRNKTIKNIKKKLNLTKILSIMSICLLTFSFSPAYADSWATLKQLNSQINDAKSNINYLQGQKASLQNEIAGFDAQINQLELQIQAINVQIGITNGKIAKNETELVKQKKILAEQLEAMYIDSRMSLAEKIFGSKSFSDFMDKTIYLDRVQEKIKDATDRIEQVKKELDSERKNNEQLKKQALVKQSELNGQKAAKEQLLASVGASEEKYQALLSSLSSQYNAVYDELQRVAASASTGVYRSYGHVNRGDVIGYQGNSGYSTGSHLHFEVRYGGGDVNPMPYLQSGTLMYPESGAHINQYWGEVGNLAGYYRHTGIDFSAGYGAPIRAATDGEIIARTSGFGNTYPGQVSYGNYVMILHPNGMVSIYGHMQ